MLKVSLQLYEIPKDPPGLLPTPRVEDALSSSSSELGQLAEPQRNSSLGDFSRRCYMCGETVTISRKRDWQYDL